uniref:Uncharacterized protein n=1 Tax=Trypanosoma congolense (strain IL3000) TaxID=1068625 RepID=G0US52_TRYCI|nr:hypothetical protein, unlikely [Trypanosoma congolense IL3000]
MTYLMRPPPPLSAAVTFLKRLRSPTHHSSLFALTLHNVPTGAHADTKANKSLRFLFCCCLFFPLSLLSFLSITFYSFPVALTCPSFPFLLPHPPFNQVPPLVS